MAQVTGIVQADSEKEHVEGRKEGCQIKRPVFRTGIHVANQLEHPRKPVVLQLHRNIILRRRLALEVDQVRGLIQQSIDLCHGIGFGPTLHYNQLAVGSLLVRPYYPRQLQLILQPVGRRGYRIHRRRTTRYGRLDRLQFTFSSLGSFGSLQIVHRRCLLLLGIYGNLIARPANNHKICRMTRIGYRLDRITLAPIPDIGLEYIGITGEVSQYDPFAGKLRNPFGRKLAPRRQILRRLAQTRYLGLERRRSRRCLDIGRISLVTIRIGSAGLEILLRALGTQRFDRLAARIHLRNQLHVRFRRLPACNGNIDQPQILQPVQEPLVFAAVKHDIIFDHLRYHTVAPSSAC